MNDAAFVETLRGIVRDVVREELATQAGPRDEYDSKRPPPGVSRAYFARECRRLGIGRRLGKTWIVSRAEWEAAKRATPPSNAERAADVSSALESSGLRLTRSTP